MKFGNLTDILGGRMKIGNLTDILGRRMDVVDNPTYIPARSMSREEGRGGGGGDTGGGRISLELHSIMTLFGYPGTYYYHQR